MNNATRALVAAAMLLVTRTGAADAKREVQDYGGPPRGATAGDVALWVPRIVLFPPWLVSELLLRRPIGALVKVAERDQWPREFFSLFTFGDRNQISVFPSALFDFGLLPSVGFNARWKYFLAEPNTIRLHFGTWGADWIAARVVDTYDFGHGESLTADVSFVRRQDNPFFGMGPRSANGGRLRYQSTTADAGFEYENRFWRASTFSARMGVRSAAFGAGGCCGNPTLGDAVAAGAVPPPPGLGEGYLAVYERLALAVDTRKARPDDGSGARFEAHGEGDFTTDPRDGTTRRSWVTYGASAGAALDVSGTERIVSLELAAELADPLNGTVPFTEQVALGGDRWMRGFLKNRLIDRSALVATLKYTWPIWVFLDGVIHADVGNVFGERFEGFDPGLLRLTTGIGVRSSGARDSGFELLAAIGTDPFEQGLDVSSFRLVIGSHHGF